MSRRAAGIGVLLVLSMSTGLVGCAQETDLLSRLLVQPETAAELGYAIQWQEDLSLSPEGRIIYTEVIGDRLITLQSANVLTVRDAASGAVEWRRQLGRPLERFSRPIRLDEERLLICSETYCYIHDFDTGEQVNLFPLSETSNTTPAITPDGLMVHGSPSGLVFAMGLEHGLERWSYDTEASITNNPLHIEDERLIIVTNDNGDVLAFQPDGQVAWQESTYGAISADPATDGQLIFIASEDQSLYAYNVTSGRQIWRYYATDPLTNAPTVVGDLLLQQIPQHGLAALNAEDGEISWNRDDLSDVRPVLLREDRLYAQHGRELLVLEMDDGQTLQRISMPKVHHMTASDFRGGDLYLVRADGVVMKLTPR